MLDLIKELSLPDDAGLLLTESQFWTPEVCVELFRQADLIGFTDPKGGLAVAREAVRMVDKLPGEYTRGSEKTLLKSRGFAILGSRLRAVAKLDESESVFMLACGLSWGALPLDVADLLRRRGMLRVDQRRFRNARVLENRALRICRQEADEHMIGCVLLARGEVYFQAQNPQEAARDYGAAADLIDADRCFISFYSAVHNLGAALVRGAAIPAELSVAVEQIERAKEIGFGPDTLPGLNLIWIQGALLEKLERDDEAEAAYQVSGAGLAALGSVYELALNRLDLAALLHRQGRLGELIDLAAEMFPLFGTFRANREVMAGLRLFHNAAVDRRVTLELISKVQAMIAQAARKVD